MERKHTFVPGEYYHAFTRGVEKRPVFMEDFDYDHLTSSLLLLNTPERVSYRNIKQKYKGLPFATIYDNERPKERLVDVVAYAFMPNHFHLLLRENQEGGISRFLGKVLTSYSMFFNVKYNRTGPLFSRPFRSTHIDTDDYLKWVFSYINLNPLSLHDPDWEQRIENKTRAGAFLREYPHSSFYDYYIDNRPQTSILNKEAFPHFSTLETMDDLVTSLAKNR